VVKDNINWCYGTDILSVKTLDVFGEKLCNELGIFYKGVVDRIEGREDLFFLHDFRVEMLDNSTVTKMLDNSTVTKMLDNSTVTEMWNNSTVTEMWDNSTVTEMWNNSTVTEMWDNSTVTEMLGNSIARSYNGNHPSEYGDRYCFVDLNRKEVFYGELSPKKKEELQEAN
jgi:hypothetical protein